MSKKLHIPKDLHEAFIKLIKLLPAHYRNDKDIQQTILTYLKLKGEEFVRDGIEGTWEHFYEKNGKKHSKANKK